jgi:2-polyprenyl-3-methyl-5-hydroxy-6-metoxy-1,4-benzoquinol methylase
LVRCQNFIGKDHKTPIYTRFLGNQISRAKAFVEGAKSYVDKGGPSGVQYLFRKPFNLVPNDPSYFMEMYQVLNILTAMDLPPGGRIVEVGSGPGWLTEILVLLGFEVDAVEPSEAMIRIAQERLEGCRKHYHLAEPPQVRFHAQCLEDCSLAAECFDGIIFHESLHHVIDENAGLAKCFTSLRPGGVLGISGETAWTPGWTQLEQSLREEMERYGTLENPFTLDLLKRLLQDHGFEDITHYHGINGLFPVEQENMTIRQAAQFPGFTYNTLTARKPGGGPTTAGPCEDSLAKITVIEKHLDTNRRKLSIKTQLTNLGKTTWLHRQQVSGYVTVALREGNWSGACESAHYCLPQKVAPGQQLVLDLVFHLPEEASPRSWWLDLVNEQRYWFSDRGTVPAEVKLDGK